MTLYATGHLNPSIALAVALEKRDHQIVFFNIVDIAPGVTQAGLDFVTYGQDAYPQGSLAALIEKAAECRGASAFANYLERMETLFSAAFKDLPGLLELEQLDLLVIDQVYFAGATLAEHAGSLSSLWQMLCWLTAKI